MGKVVDLGWAWKENPPKRLSKKRPKKAKKIDARKKRMVGGFRRGK